MYGSDYGGSPARSGYGHSGSPARSGYGGSPHGYPPRHGGEFYSSPRRVEYMSASGGASAYGGDVNSFEALKRAISEADIDTARRIVHSEVLTPASLGNLFVWVCMLTNTYRVATGVRMLIDAGVFVNVQNDSGLTPLMAAAVCGQREVCEVLLSHGADLHAADPHGHTPLFLAMDKGHDALCCALIDKGADVNGNNAWGYSILMLAAVSKCPQTCLKILSMKQAYYDLNETRRKEPNVGWTALFFAISHRLTDVARAMLAKGASVTRPDGAGRTPLVLALETGQLALALEVLNRKAPLTARITKAGPRHRWTPLHFAVEARAFDVCDAMFTRAGWDKANVNLGAGECAGTPLMVCVASWNAAPAAAARMFDALVARGADVDAQGKDGQGALHVAVEHSGEAVGAVEALMAAGADIELRDARGRTPLLHAAALRKMHAAGLLLRGGAHSACNEAALREALAQAEASFAKTRSPQRASSREASRQFMSCATGRRPPAENKGAPSCTISIAKTSYPPRTHPDPTISIANTSLPPTPDAPADLSFPARRTVSYINHGGRGVAGAPGGPGGIERANTSLPPTPAFPANLRFPESARRTVSFLNTSSEVLMRPRMQQDPNLSLANTSLPPAPNPPEEMSFPALRTVSDFQPRSGALQTLPTETTLPGTPAPPAHLVGRHGMHGTGCTETLVEMIENAGSGAGGADVNAADKEGLTPLMLAAEAGSKPLCVMLVEGGAWTSPRSQGRTARDFAVAKKRDAVAKMPLMDPATARPPPGPPMAPAMSMGTEETGSDDADEELLTGELTLRDAMEMSARAAAALEAQTGASDSEPAVSEHASAPSSAGGAVTGVSADTQGEVGAPSLAAKGDAQEEKPGMDDPTVLAPAEEAPPVAAGAADDAAGDAATDADNNAVAVDVDEAAAAAQAAGDAAVADDGAQPADDVAAGSDAAVDDAAAGDAAALQAAGDSPDCDAAADNADGAEEAP
eukprot:TRINITY_DN5959_c0_g1_i1.p1 TRINITY_DN5959_c0_g1~~TRINITY_DN5959_c0_g1_i1.p1  ORF type:complete len:979 (+),score=221.20 TRINITY_DN5959_c0_g1_i1:91-3027(+)